MHANDYATEKLQTTQEYAPEYLKSALLLPGNNLCVSLQA